MTGGTLFAIILFCISYVGACLLLAAAATQAELHVIPKLKQKILGLLTRAYRRVSDDEYRRSQQRAYDRRKKENRPWDEV